MKDSFKFEISNLKTFLKQEINSEKTENAPIKSEIGSLKGSVKTEIGSLKDSVKTEIGSLNIR